MQLTPEEQRRLDGSNGEADRFAMEFLVKVGEFFDAESLVDVGYAHLIYEWAMILPWGVALVEDMYRKGARFRAYTTTNCLGFDPQRWADLGVEGQEVEHQRRLTDMVYKMGAIGTHTQAIALMGSVPRFGQHVAYTESETVTFANSYFGARTNLEGYAGAFIEAIAGKTPKYGLHLWENRRANVIVDVQTPLTHLSDWSALGYFVGQTLRRYDVIPAFVNLPLSATETQLKHIAAALPTFGTIAMFHAVGITPEAPTLERAFDGRKPKETLVVQQKDLRGVYAQFGGSETIDAVWIGNPPMSVQELRMFAELLGARKIKKGMDFLLFTFDGAKVMADNMGITRSLEDAGCHIYTSACPIMIAGNTFADRYDGKTVMTTDTKTCCYGTSLMGSQNTNTKIVLGSAADCVRAAVG